MPSCAFRKCTNNSRNTNKVQGVTFHSFPQEQRCKEKWIKVIQKDQRDEEWLSTKFSRICSAHFLDKDFYVTQLGRRKIKSHAIPAFQPIAEPCIADHKGDAGPGSPQDDVHASDEETITDSPRKFRIKIKLSIDKCKREKCKKEILNLKKEIKYLKSENSYLREIVYSLKRNEVFVKTEIQ